MHHPVLFVWLLLTRMRKYKKIKNISTFLSISERVHVALSKYGHLFGYFPLWTIFILLQHLQRLFPHYMQHVLPCQAKAIWSPHTSDGYIHQHVWNGSVIFTFTYF